MKFMLGVDEAGRAPLAGPVAVGVVAVPAGFDVAREFPGVKDSKQLTERAREKIFAMLSARAKAGDVRFRVCYGSHEEIDTRGITIAVKRAVRRGILALAPLPRRALSRADATTGTSATGQAPDDVFVYLDGSLHAPVEYAQETVIHGDDLIPIISLASVAAKVSRDRLMRRFARTYPVYAFDKHKGYPTKAHYEALKSHGPCAIHRRSYLHLDLTSERS